MITIQVIPDRFQSKLNGGVASGIGATKDDNFPIIRRPTRGIVLKEETFATMKVITGNGQSITVVDAGARRKLDNGKFLEIGGKRYTDIYSNFLLQSVSEERQEKQQVLETFGEPYIFLFGERARVMNFSGVLINTFDFNWEAEWWHNYDNYLRGSRCVENDAQVFITFDETAVSGYIIASSAVKDTNNPHHIQFQFQFFVTNYSTFSNLGKSRASDSETNRLSGGEQEFGIAASTLKAFGPKLIDTTSKPFTAVTNGKVGTLSLVEGLLQTGLGTVVKAFNTAQQIAGGALQALSNLANGVVVRVPLGFEGSLAFDDDGSTALYRDEFGNPQVDPVSGAITYRAKYTTFDKNDDEYVGRSSQFSYISSSNSLRDILDPFERTLKQQENDINADLKRARDIWKKNGFTVPSSQLGPISSFIAGKGVGLLAAGASSAWGAAAGASSVAAAVPRIR